MRTVREQLSRVLDAFGTLFLVILFLAATSGAISSKLLPDSRWAEFAGDFPQYCALLMLVGSFGFRRKMLPLALALLAGANALYQHFPPPEELSGEPSGEEIRIVSFNLFWKNRDFESFHRFVADEAPHIIALQEVHLSWPPALEALKDRYPHRFVLPHTRTSGTALLSVFPLSELRVDRELAFFPALIATVRHPKGDFLLINPHLESPQTDEWFHQRNQGLEKLAAMVRNAGPTIVAGDLNVTPTSPHYRRFVERSGLCDPRQGRQQLGTWPAMFPPLLIAIDHVLPSKEFELVSLKQGPNIGSDHLPILARFRHKR